MARKDIKTESSDLKLGNRRRITPIMTLEQLIVHHLIIDSGSRQHKCLNVVQTQAMIQVAAKCQLIENGP